MKDISIIAAAVPLAAATAKTALQVTAPTHQRVEVPFLEVSFDGISPTDRPVDVKVMRQTTAVTSGTSITIIELPNGDPGTVQTTAIAGDSDSVEPTLSDVYWQGYLHPQGRHIIARPNGKPFAIIPAERLGVVCNAPDAVNVTVCVPVATE